MLGDEPRLCIDEDAVDALRVRFGTRIPTFLPSRARGMISSSRVLWGVGVVYGTGRKFVG